MSRIKSFKDSFVTGLLTGAISMVLFFYLLSGIRSFIINYSGNLYMLRPPAVQLFTMIINVILFRILMLNYNKENIAKGFLFITVIATLIYFYIFYRINK